jgi:predicted TIM-barrel fold metal-dependent hydrolase
MSLKRASTLAILLGLGLSSAQAAGPKNRPVYLGQPLEAIDIHMHPGRYEDLGPVGRDFLRKTLPNFLPTFLKDFSLSAASSFLLNPYGAFIGIKSDCEQAGVTMCGLFAVYAPETWGVTSNETLLGYLNDKKNKASDGKPIFFGLASVRMQDWAETEQAELANLRKTLDHPLVRGIKLAFIHNSIPLDDPQYDSVYTVAEQYQVPVYHHVGSSPLRKLSDFATEAEQEQYLKSYDPARLERAIKKFPNTNFILGHMGFDFNKEGYNSLDTVLDLAERYPNVYLEISAFGDPMHDPQGIEMDTVLREIKARNLIGRTIFGSDGPTIPGGTKTYLKSTLSSMEKLGYTYEEAKAVLAENTIRIFRIQRK